MSEKLVLYFIERSKPSKTRFIRVYWARTYIEQGNFFPYSIGDYSFLFRPLHAIVNISIVILADRRKRVVGFKTTERSNMDFQKVVDSVAALSCIISVEKLADGGYGDIRIVTGNEAYIDSIQNPGQDDVEMLTREFIPNSLYTEYLTRDMNFENYCYGAAVEKKCLHSYAHPDRYDVWFNMTFLPLWPDDGNLCYCMYTMEINLEPSSERMSNIKGDIAAAVLETALTFRATKDFRKAMQNVVEDILELCEAESCTVLLVDHEKEQCEVQGTVYAEGASVRSSPDYFETNFYPVASTWKDTISGSNCIIAKNEQEFDVIRERNPIWYNSLKEKGVRSIALFPLKAKSEHIGYMWVSNFREDRAEQIKEILELTVFVLEAETDNHLMTGKLKELSARDMLTGVMNRNEMNNYVDWLSELPDEEKNSVGVLFGDLNGLKRVNDTQGHNAGDILLRNAASALKEVFDDRCIFRAGGDEFVVILRDVSPDRMEQDAEALRASAEHYPEVSFAIGCGFDEDCRKVRKALADADKRMYADKEKYYSEGNRKKYR